MNEIFIKGLEVWAHIGVPDEEREKAQRLLIDVVIEPQTAFRDLGDEIARTVDYDVASMAIRDLASGGPRHLIETLAVEIADVVLDRFPARRITVEIKKFILPDTEYVAVRYERATDDSPAGPSGF